MTLVLEVAVLQIVPGLTEDFEQNFKKASEIISKMKGYIHHELKRCIENRNKYILLVRWETLEDHNVGFRKSVEYQAWKDLLHHFYDPFPMVEHFDDISK